MLPTPLCGMFSSKHATIVNLTYMPIDKKKVLHYWVSNKYFVLITIKVGSWKHLEQIPTVMVLFVKVTFVLVTFVPVRNISDVTDQILTEL